MLSEIVTRVYTLLCVLTSEFERDVGYGGGRKGSCGRKGEEQIVDHSSGTSRMTTSGS